MATAISPKSKCPNLLVAAIDLGTTYSGYAFSFKHEYDKDPFRVTSITWTASRRSLTSTKTPTALLLTPQKSFDSFGFEAEDKYSELKEDDLHEEWYYFSRFMMMPFEKIGLKRDIMLDDNSGKQMPAQEIFSMSIKYFKDHLMAKLHKWDMDITEDHVQWVLTVPAISNDETKQFMHKAAEKAGIDGQNLIIALEPEAAYIYCMNIHLDKDESGKSKVDMLAPFQAQTKYMVVDVGGGTVDISVHEVQAGGIVKLKASSEAWSGTEAFTQLLIKIVGADVLYKFRTEKTADYVDMLRDFETKIRHIRQDITTKVTFQIPASLMDTFEEIGVETIKEALAGMRYGDKLSWRVDKMRIASEIVRELFKESLNSMFTRIAELLKDKDCVGTDRILLVGDSSESPMLQHAIKEKFRSIRIIKPPEAGIAVLTGAVLFGHNPDAIATWNRDFEVGVHQDSKKYHVGGARVNAQGGSERTDDEIKTYLSDVKTIAKQIEQERRKLARLKEKWQEKFFVAKGEEAVGGVKGGAEGSSSQAAVQEVESARLQGGLPQSAPSVSARPIAVYPTQNPVLVPEEADVSGDDKSSLRELLARQNRLLESLLQEQRKTNEFLGKPL